MRSLLLSLVLSLLASAQTPQAGVKTIPPPGIPVPAADRVELQAALARLTQTLEPLRANPLYPDAAIYAKAVRFAVEGNEFFKPAEIASAKDLLKQGQARADALATGTAPWQSATGLLVRAYTSKIDGSLQPYGLVIPTSFAPDLPHKWRLDLWFHGRNETLSEINFIIDRQKNPGEFTPRDTIVLHLYGRYCNANKFAGEVDLFEALDDLKRHYNIDERRISVRGFSMGGAAVWHIAAHHAGLWAAAAPGAGFAETREFVPAYHKQQITPSWYEEKLWHWTDATDYALNFAQLPVVAYNGEIDPQKQAADIMARYLAREGMTLTRIVGPNTAHKYHPAAKVEINRLIDPIVERGNEPTPKKIHFTTWTLAYNQMKWITVDGLEKHWERARIDAEITSDHAVQAQTGNISSLTLRFGPGGAPFDPTKMITVTLDGQPVQVPGPDTARTLNASFHKQSGKWVAGEDTAFRKRHNLQGPIDDAFLSASSW
ncbi:MAG: prolyl oligopeptidase family serine peptidase [Acidobacteriota bacterium]|nr:prolyl oligopeptidase family serine peptidase [Acidobacteriota bacterium]